MKTTNQRWRPFSLRVFAVGIFAIQALTLNAQTNQDPTHDGQVVRVEGNKLVMKAGDGQEHSHNLGAETQLTLDGVACKLSDLKPQTRIRVTTQPGDQQLAIRIEALDKNLAFASHVHEGTFVSATPNRITFQVPEGKETSLTVKDDVLLTLDGKNTTFADWKKGTKIRVFTATPFSQTVARVEAIDQNKEFASNRAEGEIISWTGELLNFRTEDGQQHTRSLVSSPLLTLDGVACRIADLKAGLRIRVTTQDAFSNWVTGVEGIDRNSAFALESHDGIVVRLIGNQLKMTDLQGKHEHTCTISNDVRITLDGNSAMPSELRPGMKIRVTPENANSPVAIRIEAINKQRSFSASL